MNAVEVLWHPLFRRWFEDLLEESPEIAGEIMALLAALEEHGTELGDPESHPVVTSGCRLRALRRTPPTDATPYAVDPPVLRVLYGFVADQGRLKAVALYGGDKTTLRNRWYPPAVLEAERRLVAMCGRMGWEIRRLTIST